MSKILVITIIFGNLVLSLQAQIEPKVLHPGEQFMNTCGDTLVVLSISGMAKIIAESEEHTWVRENQKMLIENLQTQLKLYKADQLNREQEISYWKSECFRLNEALEKKEIQALLSRHKYKRNNWLIAGGMALGFLALLVCL